MKITIYELLGMVKDGKLMPERIKFENYIYIWRNTQKDYFCEQINHSLESIIGEDLFSNLNLEVEILEEEKKIPEKLSTYTITDETISGMRRSLNAMINIDIIGTINEVIDYLKSKEDRYE